MKYLSLVLLLSPVLAAVAGPVYKSIGEDGAVTYSSQPPVDAVHSEPVTLPSAPSAEAQEQARERMRKAEQSAADIGTARAAREGQEESVRRMPQPTGNNAGGNDNYYYGDRRPAFRPGIPGRPGKPGMPRPGPRTSGAARGAR